MQTQKTQLPTPKFPVGETAISVNDARKDYPEDWFEFTVMGYVFINNEWVYLDGEMRQRTEGQIIKREAWLQLLRERYDTTEDLLKIAKLGSMGVEISNSDIEAIRKLLEPRSQISSKHSISCAAWRLRFSI